MSLKVEQDSNMLSPESADRPRFHSFQSGIGSHVTGKDILVFCDGTGKDGKQGTDDKTNVWRLYQLALSPKRGQSGWGLLNNSTLRQNEIIYLPGVGSGSNRNPYNLLVRIFGSTIVENIVQAYLHVAKHYEGTSKVYLFGYSRGAFVVRKVASLIYRIGIIREREEMLKLWDRHERPVAWNLIESPPVGSAIRIQALAVWDTVGAIRSVRLKSKMEADILGMSDEELPPNVNNAFHVVAFHENRKLFRVWFPGAHSDVGGGDVKRVGLPDISLIWIIGELQTACSLVVSHEDLDYPTDIQSLLPSNAYRDSPKWKRLVDKCEPRLGLLKNSSLVHETVVHLKNPMADHLDPRSKPKLGMLMITDLSSIGWDIKTNLVLQSAFEHMKRMNTVTKQKLYRNRLNSAYMPRTPRSSISSIDQALGINERNPQSRRSTITGNKIPDTSLFPQSTSPLMSIRHRVGSHALPRSPSHFQAMHQPGDVRHPAGFAQSGGVLPFQEPVPGPWRPNLGSSSKPRGKDRDKAHPKEDRRPGKSGHERLV